VIRDSTMHAIIIGGGASAVLFACQLLRDSASAFHVTIVERRTEVGRGIAYHTANPDHVLNVRASNMSALPDQPDHFWRWLCTRSACDTTVDPYCFVPRQIYGDYIAGLIGPLLAGGRLSIVRGECVAASESRSGVAVALADGTCLTGDVAVLATGHEASSNCSDCYADPWSTPSAAGIETDASLLILGTGLTMVDYVLSLLLDGHRGPIVAMSRRGLLPAAHHRTEPFRIEPAAVPFGTSFNQLFRWFRQRIRAHVAGGGDWRDIVDAIRPHTQRLWSELPLESKRRFLEHARAWWDVHRHRMAPEVAERINQAVASRRLTVIAAKITNVEERAVGALVHYRRRSQANTECIQVAKIIDCTGIIKNPMQTTNRVLQSLFDQGLARVDPLRIGIEVSPDCAIVNRYGTPSQRLFAVGPLTRSAFWEIVAVPDIRNQCAELAARLTRTRADIHNVNAWHLAKVNRIGSWPDWSTP
jgi:uncharacterized NAD(P)/FAD-binding protein YdhS